MSHRLPGPTLCFYLALAAILLGVGSAALNFAYHRQVLSRVYLVERKIAEEAKLLTSTWTSGGIQRSWTSTLQPDETVGALVERHQAEMVTMKNAFPPDTPDGEEGR